MVAWPTTLNHLAERGTFRYSQNEDQLRSDLERGPARMRRRFTRQIATAQFSVVMDNYDFSTFRSFWLYKLNAGVNWFDLPVWNGNAYTVETVRAVAPYEASDFAGMMTTVSLSLEIRDHTTLAEGTGEITAVYDYDVLMNMSDLVHRHVNIYWEQTGE